MIRDLPRPFRAWLSATLPSDWRDDIVRDLEEAWSGRIVERGPVAAYLWLAVQCLAFGTRFAPARLKELRIAARPSSMDVRLAIRASLRAPFVTALTVVSVSAGVFATLTGWTWIVGSLFSELPFEGGDRIVLVEDYNLTQRYSIAVRAEEFLRRREMLESFEYLTAFSQQNLVIGGGDEAPDVRQVLLSSWDFLHMTEVEPYIGRLPTLDDIRPGSPPVVVLPHSDWTTFTGADPSILGQTLEVGGIQRTVIGVMPEGFGFPWSDDLWIPTDVRDVEGSLRLVGKLRPGVDLTAARAEVAATGRPDAAQVFGGDVVEHVVTGVTRPTINQNEVFIVGAPIGVLILILLVMSTNVANLMVARNARRSSELAIRGALGASRGRLVGQLAAEVAVLVATSVIAATWASQYAIGLFVSRVDLPMFTDYSLGPGTIAFAAGLALLVTLVAGVVPARRATGRTPGDTLREATRGSSSVHFGRLTGSLIVVQVAICVGFLSTATLLGQSLLSYTFDRYGIPAEETLIAQIYFGFPQEINDPESGLSSEERERARTAFMDEATRKRGEMAEQVLDLPGVRMSGFGSRFPGNESEQVVVEIEGSEEAVQRVETADAGPGYFEVVGISAIQGRLFEAAEYRRGAGVVVVNEPFVRDPLRGANAVGRRIRLLDGSTPPEEIPWSTIVGVVPDLGLNPGNPERAAAVYQPLAPINIVRMAIRGDGNPGSWTPQLVDIIRRIDPDIRVQWSRTLQEQMNQPIAIFRGMAVAFLVLGALALVLSAASIHALTGTAVTRRTRELGIRQALGASRSSIARSILGRTAAQLAMGGLVGAGIAGVLLRLATVMPWEVRQSNPVALSIVVGAVALAGIAALARPLVRALSIRPADAMRAE